MPAFYTLAAECIDPERDKRRLAQDDNRENRYHCR